MDRALMHSDNCYKIPHVRVTGRICRTNQASNTAFRGFGGPQGLMFAEMWTEQIARVVGKTPTQIRELNLYQEGMTTHFGQVCDTRTFTHTDTQTHTYRCSHSRQARVRKPSSTNRPARVGKVAVAVSVCSDPC